MFAVGFLQVSQLLSVHCSWTCENAKMVAYARMKVPHEESFKVQFILHVRFIVSSKVVDCSKLEEVCDVLVSSPGQPLSLDRTQGRQTI